MKKRNVMVEKYGKFISIFSIAPRHTQKYPQFSAHSSNVSVLHTFPMSVTSHLSIFVYILNFHNKMKVFFIIPVSAIAMLSDDLKITT